MAPAHTWHRRTTVGGTSTTGMPTNTPAHPQEKRGQRTKMPRWMAPAHKVRAIFAIARRNRLDPKNLLLERFGLERPEDLSIRDASSLIDDLKRGVAGVRA